MIVYLTIESDNSKWKLQANYDEIKKRYYGVSLAIPMVDDIWDSPRYLFEDLAVMVKAMYANNNEDYFVSNDNFPVHKWLIDNREEIPQLNEILQYAVGLGWGKIK